MESFSLQFIVWAPRINSKYSASILTELLLDFQTLR